jgi:hypothetical protein
MYYRLEISEKTESELVFEFFFFWQSYVLYPNLHDKKQIILSFLNTYSFLTIRERPKYIVINVPKYTSD